MKQTFRKNDFDINNIPATRKAQVKDFLKNDIFTLLKAAIIIFVFFIPEIILVIYKNNTISNIVFSYSNNEIAVEEFRSLLSIVYLTSNLIHFITIFLIFFAFCGVLRVFRVLFWNEGVFFLSDFFKGIKNNILRSLVYSLLFSMLLFVIDELYLLMCDNAFEATNIIYNLLTLVLFLVILPLLLIMMELDNFYNYTLGDCFINGTKFLGKFFFMFLIFVLPILSILALRMFNSIILIIFIFILIALYSFFFPLLFHAFTLSKFDDLINNNHLEIKRKGLKN